MGENRYYVEQELLQGSEIPLAQEELKHIRVMRKTPGDTLELVNGRGALAKATLTPSQTAKIVSLETKNPESKTIILAQAYLKPQNLDLVIEKATELGATAIWLFPGDKSEKKELSENRKTRLKNLTISALKQCGRLFLPPLIEKGPLSNWDRPPHPLFYGDPEAKEPFAPKDSLIIVIGPESGFSPKELTCLKAMSAQAVLLNPNTLRAETAALCALAKCF